MYEPAAICELPVAASLTAVTLGTPITKPSNKTDIPAALAVTVGDPVDAPPNTSAHAIPYASVLHVTALPLLSGEHPGCPPTLFNAAPLRGATANDTGAFATGAPDASISLTCNAPPSPFTTVSNEPSANGAICPN